MLVAEPVLKLGVGRELGGELLPCAGDDRDVAAGGGGGVLEDAGPAGPFIGAGEDWVAGVVQVDGK